MRHLHFSTAAALVLVLFAARPAAAQPLRDDVPPPPKSEPASETGFLGLFADDPETPGKGVVITSVHAGGPAEAAGIRKGDIVAAINGKLVATVDEMEAAIGAVTIGKEVKIEVIRGGRHIVNKVTVARRPVQRAERPVVESPLETPVRPVPPVAGGVPLDIGSRATLGVRLLPLTDDARRKYGIVGKSGAVIETIRDGSAADKFGLPLGGVIFSLDGRRIEGPDDVVNALRTMRPGDEVEIGYYQGDRMFRKLVRLAPATPSAPVDSPLLAPPAEPEPKVPPGLPGLGDRPGIKKLEGLLDRLLPPPGVAGAAVGSPSADLTAPRPAEDRREVTELRSEIELLKAEISRLNKRLAEIEGRLPDNE